MFRERFEKEMRWTEEEMAEIQAKGGYTDPDMDIRFGMFIGGWSCAVNAPEIFWQKFFVEQILTIRELFEFYMQKQSESVETPVLNFEHRSLEYADDATNWHFKCFIVGFSGYFNQVRKAQIQ